MTGICAEMERTELVNYQALCQEFLLKWNIQNRFMIKVCDGSLC